MRLWVGYWGYSPLQKPDGDKKRGLTQEESDLFVRRDRDSNPGNLSVQRFSRPPQSTTLPPLQGVVFESFVGIAIPFSITGAKVGVFFKPANILVGKFNAMWFFSYFCSVNRSVESI